jgi:two-component system, sensor histidine kinase
MKLRTFLLAVVGLTLVPMLGVAGVAIWWAHQDERRAMEQALLYQTRSLSVAVDREVETSLAGLRGLATSSDLDAADLRKLYDRARLAREAYPRWTTVALADPSGRQALNLLRPLGSLLPSVAGLEVFQRTVQTGEPQVSDLVTDPTAGRRVIVVTLPVLRDGKARHVLAAFMTPESFASALAAAQIAGGTVGTIVDRNGAVVATTHGPEQVGKPAPAGLISRARERDEAVFTGPAPEGSTVYTAFSRAPRSRFTVGIAVPGEQVEGPLRRSLGLLTAGAVGALVLSLGLATLAGRQFAGRLRRLRNAFSAFGRGETVPELPVFRLAELAGVSGALGEAMALMQTRTAELRESEQRYRTLFERNPAGMCLTLADGRIVDCNEAFARMLGFEHAGDVLAVNVGEFYAQPKERDQILERIKAGGTAVNAELQFRRRDGRLIWVLANVIRGSGPPRADFEATLIDITEQKAADELRSMARLANAAAHEINNPLTMILGRLAMLREDPSLPAEARDRIAQIHAAAERIREIVIDMNHLTRVQLFEHTGRGLPEMLDIRKSAGADPPTP